MLLKWSKVSDDAYSGVARSRDWWGEGYGEDS